MTPGGKPMWRALPLDVADGTAYAPAGGVCLRNDAGVGRPRTNSLEEWK